MTIKKATFTKRAKATLAAHLKELQTPESRYAAILGAIKGAGLELRDLLEPDDSNKPLTCIADALKGKGNGNRRPGCFADRIRKNAAESLGISSAAIWPNLYADETSSRVDKKTQRADSIPKTAR